MLRFTLSTSSGSFRVSTRSRAQSMPRVESRSWCCLHASLQSAGLQTLEVSQETAAPHPLRRFPVRWRHSLISPSPLESPESTREENFSSTASRDALRGSLRFPCVRIQFDQRPGAIRRIVACVRQPQRELAGRRVRRYRQENSRARQLDRLRCEVRQDEQNPLPGR